MNHLRYFCNKNEMLFLFSLQLFNRIINSNSLLNHNFLTCLLLLKHFLYGLNYKSGKVY